MELTVYNCLNVLICIYFMMIYGTSVGNSDCPSLPTLTIQPTNKCIWTTTGGNMTVAIMECQWYGGSIFTFDTMTEALELLEQANISHAESIFVGGIRNKMNDTMYYDWLNRPGTWPPELDVSIDYTQVDTKTGDQNICLKLLNESLLPCDCSTEMQITLCEIEPSDGCSCQTGMLNSDSSNSTPTSEFLSTLIDQSVHVIQDVSDDGVTIASPSNRTIVGLSENQQVPVSRGTQTSDILEILQNQTTHIFHDDDEYGGNMTSLTNQTMVDLSEVQSVPGPNGSIQIKNMSSIFSYVMSHVIDSSTENEKQQQNQTGEELLEVQRNNTTLKLTFSDLLELVKDSSTGNFSENTNSTDTSAATNSTCSSNTLTGNSCSNKSTTEKDITNNATSSNNKTDFLSNHRNPGSNTWPSFLNGLFGRNHTFPNGMYQNGSVPIREVKFQVSGVGTGNARPKEFSNTSAPQVKQSSSVFVKNVTNTLNSLQEKTSVDSKDITTFTDIVQGVSDTTNVQTASIQDQTDMLFGMLSVAEQMMNDLADPLENVTVITESIEITSSLVTNIPTNGSHLPIERGRTESQLKLSAAIFSNSSFIAYRVSTIIYKAVGPLVKVSNSHVSSDVISVSVQNVVGNVTKPTSVNSDDAVIFTMKTFVEKTKTEKTRVCTFLDFTKKAWSTTGCQVMSKNFTHTTCKCNHLTNFAILVMYIETEDISLGNQQALFTLTTVGCSLSIACLAMTIITYIYLRMLGREKIMIHANLSLALLLGQLVFVSSSDAYKQSGVCKAIAIILHFLFMSSFTWMMVEGVALYRCCTRGVFNQRDMRIKYFLLGWGPPALIVTVSVAIEFPDYGNGPQYSCWLSIHNGLIWAFLGPMILIVLLNMLVMGLVVKVFLTLKTNTQKTEVARLRGSVRAMLTLLPLLGLTWITSLLVPYSVVFHYLFIIINTVQGMCIFFFHCICNDEIRRKFREKTRRWSGSRTGSDVDVSHQQRRKAGVRNVQSFEFLCYNEKRNKSKY